MTVDMSRVGLVWIDTQGHEGHVLNGAGALLEFDVPVVCEYWPDGLRSAGGLGLFHDLVARHYRIVVDLRASVAQGAVIEHRASEVAALEGVYRNDAGTDLILLK